MGRSAFVAALFAVHPLHVESVAWISERKDVLSTLFMLLTLWAYFVYTVRPTLLRYSGTVLLFALGLMAKPMLVTLPFVLLLLDGWPLNRISLKPFDWSAAWRLIKEKLPLFALAAASSIITFIVQREGGAVASIDNVPLTLRLANALVSYIEYILNMTAPVGLAVLYPFPESVPIWKASGATVALLLISTFAIKVRSRLPYFPVGWFMYLGTLVPVIGVVQVGSQAMADRYTYVPLIGLFIIIAWGLYDLLGKNSSKQSPLIVTAVLVIGVLTAISWTQVRYWQNSNLLWARAVDVTEDNYRAHTAYGSLMEDQGALTQAVEHFTRAVQIQPSHAIAHNKLGAVLSDLNRPADAIGHYLNALRIQPDFAEVHNNLGNALAAVGRHEEALQHFESAISIKPEYASPYNGMGSVLDDLERVDEAITSYSEAIRIDPRYAAAHNNLATAYFKKGKLNEATEASRIVLMLEPGNASYQYNHAVYMIYNGDTESARNHLELALEINPGYTPAIEALATLP
jgi:Flp pilus assembly protein TadD